MGGVVRFRREGLRLDQAVAEVCGVSRAKAQDWIARGLVRVGEQVVVKPAYRLKGEEVVVKPLEERPMVLPEDFALPVLYEDEDLLVLNKPPGLLSHPAPGVYTGTVVNALLGRYFPPPEGEVPPERVRPGIVHRLDKDTSGVLVVAKRPGALEALSRAFRDRMVMKRYLALTEGHPREGTLIAPIGRHPVERHKMHVGGVASRYAETEFQVLGRAGAYALVEARPHTGRTHQIRVHLKHLRAPVLGDELYGRKSPYIPRQALHAYELRLPHPRTGRVLEFLAPVPRDMVAAWRALGGEWPEGIALAEDPV